VDAEFLKEIESWRETLAKEIAIRNPKLSVKELNFAVQLTIDRIIFLRMCEDRGIEKYGQIQNLLNGTNTYRRLREIFYHADDKYNSGLFDFKTDRLTPELKVDDKPLKDIFKNLYYPESPYEFSVLGTDILGHVYEQFLGKVIRLTEGHRAKVEEKPEVRKAGGVYYTPTYIVDYIVKNTVGEICEGKSPRQVSSLRVLDPACGSGSFLLGAYQYLSDYHLNWYLAHHSKKGNIAQGFSPAPKEMYRGRGGQWYLTIQEKKRILLNNIYGVDIDPQAVEVTKLSLLLKVLEDENQDTLERQMKLFKERALPDLGSNIKCGNSLIGPDFYSVGTSHDLPNISVGADHDLPALSLKARYAPPNLNEEETYRINPFDWQKEFPEIMKAGGFDTVIGNPPYLYSAGQTYYDYFVRNYQLCQYQTDFYVFFIERALTLARPRGKVSFIVSDSWLNSQHFSKLRNHLLTEHRIDVVAVFDYPVFANVALENSIFVVTASEKPNVIIIDRFSKPNTKLTVNKIDPYCAMESGLIDPRRSSASERVIKAMERNSNHLERYVKLNRGIHAYRTDGYGKSKFGPGPQTKKDKETCSYHADKALDKTYLPELKGKDVGRFTFKLGGKYLSYGHWLAEPREPEYFFKPKIALRKILGPKLHGTFIEEPIALDQSLYILISRNDDSAELKYFLGVLLSRLGAWYLRTKYAIYDTLYPWYTKKQLAAFPIKKKDDRIVNLVEQMLSLHKQLAAAKTPDEKTRIQRQIETTDHQINQLVYKLYGLTENEIQIIEGET
jgi:type I restriction-modification system DNA methylase subunit